MNNKPLAENPSIILIGSIIILFFALIFPAKTIANNRPFIESKTKVILTEEETRKTEEIWSIALESHTKKLAQAFQQYSPNDYCGYIKFKKKTWGPAFDKDHDIIYNRWIAISDRWSLRYNKLHEIFTAWANLNNASIYMECYLRYGRKEDLVHVQEKLGTIWAVLPTSQKISESKQYRTVTSPFPWKFT